MAVPDRKSGSNLRRDSKVQGPASSSKVHRGDVPSKGSGSKVHRPEAAKPPSSTSMRRPNFDAAPEDAPRGGTKIRPREESPDAPAMKLKKAAFLSIPILIVILVILVIVKSMQDDSPTGNGVKKNPVVIVKRDFAKEIKQAEDLYDEAFEIRKKAMFADTPSAKQNFYAQATEIAQRAIKLCDDAWKEVKDEPGGFEYIEEMKKRIEDFMKIVDKERNPDTEKKDDHGKTTTEPGGGS